MNSTVQKVEVMKPRGDIVLAVAWVMKKTVKDEHEKPEEMICCG